ncbi:hypothetical protein DEO72_LG4g1077 [Vigna unguiculata]|uniref:Uncharacterized protein n=1 Tax=Vigna unguiculata TaxID=3917 RepID=A0A4D6LNS5_VIGUN|nr:hypothetical protein DEO72_LG4g1077 [Vigna unguiculata]
MLPPVASPIAGAAASFFLLFFSFSNTYTWGCLYCRRLLRLPPPPTADQRTVPLRRLHPPPATPNTVVGQAILATLSPSFSKLRLTFLLLAR